MAGGSLQAATALCSGRYHRAVHFDGGRHHAHKSRADGFCYINDVVGRLLPVPLVHTAKRLHQLASRSLTYMCLNLGWAAGFG